MIKSLASMLSLAVAIFVLPLQAEDLLTFGGGRPFVPKRLAEGLKLAGCTVKLIDSTKLAGFGGASTKVTPGNPLEKEPPKADGITPEFARLGNYKAVMFHNFPDGKIREMLTPERVEALKNYVKNGGALILNRQAPAKLGDLLPVKFTGKAVAPQKGLIEERPRHEKFSLLPEKWEALSRYRPCEIVPGAEALSNMLLDGKTVSVGVAKMNYGKGTVWFFNADWMRFPGLKQFWSWAYGKAFMASLVSAATGVEMNIANTIAKIPQGAPHRQLEKLTLKVTEPVSGITPVKSVKQQGALVVFGNGVKLNIRKNGVVEIIYPGATNREKIKMTAPTVQLSGAPERVVGDEAFIDMSKLKKYHIKWTMSGYKVFDDRVEISFTGNEGSAIRWVFRAGDMTLDGRKFTGIADNVIVDKMPVLLNSLQFNAVLPPSFIRRTAVYSRPRGYIEGNLDNENGLKNIGQWQMFCGGQPFVYNKFASGLFLEFPATPVPCYVNQRAFVSAKGSSRNLRLILGRLKAPQELPALWHFFSPGEERGNNDFMATWQFVRLNLKSQFGIKTFPLRTCATLYLHGTKLDAVERAVAAAKKYNFSSVYLMFGQCRLEYIASDRAAVYYDIVHKYGMKTHPWSPGYAASKYEPAYIGKENFYLKNRKGETHSYGGKLPVVDFNNPDFRKWYFGVVDRAASRGLDEIYVDMMGQSSSNVNYAGDSAEPNLKGVIEVFKFWSDRNIPFAIEGMNPLGRDQALFGSNKDANVTGKEFAYVGGTPLTSGDRPAINFDYFRLLMHNATTNIHTDGVAENFDRFPGECAAFERIGRVNAIMNKAFEFVPAPWVRETPCGTVWMGKDTGALFFYDAVKNLKLELPAGWRVVKGSKLTGIPAESVIFIEKVK